MVRLNGLFSSFDNFDQINIESLASWLKPAPPLVILENYVANKILYPQTLPATQDEMRIDLAILREVIKMSKNKSPFLNISLRKILIPSSFLRFLPNLINLTWVFVDSLLMSRKRQDWFEDLWTVILTDDRDEVAGSILLPQFKDKNEVMELEVMDKNYKIRAGSLVVIPCQKDRCEISYKLPKGKILGKGENAVEVYGGKLGLMIDGRNQ
ncbi:hypothetical protein HY384_01675 [Candidatus Daviesbacteria bacterium]|nr:hypothetical protein [Candidatus Daviesbacteria bacterium]